LISGSLQRPLFSCFFSKDGAAAVGGEENLRDIIIYCDGAHFTLLRPQSMSPRSTGAPGFSVLNRLLYEAREAGLIVQINEVESEPGGGRISVLRTLWDIMA
jgi:hypothetical protein